MARTPQSGRKSGSTAVKYVENSSSESDNEGPSRKKKVVMKNTKRVRDDSDEDFEEEEGKEESPSASEEGEEEDVKESGSGSDSESDAEMSTVVAKGEEPIDVSSSAEEEEEEEAKPATTTKKRAPPRKKSTGAPATKRGPPLDESLPPLSDLPSIFKDLVSRIGGKLKPTLEKLDGRALRVGTMCSGTESPLLALGLISDALEEMTGSKLKVKHIFSCEIEPFKQAYIERNFAPPLLFRDVTELGEKEALTAYGGLAAVPGGIDILIAGTSCVDYSPLNTKQKKIDAGGESGRTFFGMLDYVVAHQPPIVILENVAGAPWDEVAVKFKEIGYRAVTVRLDTKTYYLPHTRVRGYLMAVPMASASSIPSQWVDLMSTLKRSASTTLEAFLLPSDDPKTHQARKLLAKARSQKIIKRAPTPWAKCESRHYRARHEEELGPLRPYTFWPDGGGDPKFPDGSWKDWGPSQTERVWDLTDISYLRMAKTGSDVSYKSALWNLSQNVDRSTASPTLAICPCLTPNMIPFLTIRGGPITGMEALMLQGIPSASLMLTRESEDQLADLAGNAMSSTVVGAAILAALCCAGATLPTLVEDEDDAMNGHAASGIIDVESRIRDDSHLSTAFVDLYSCPPLPSSLLHHANLSARQCICEGRSGIASTPISQCSSCFHSSCEDCLGRPTHKYVKKEGERMEPDVFIKEAKKVLPMRFGITEFNLEGLNKLGESLKEGNVPIDEKLWKAYIETVAAAVEGVDFCFRTLTRRQIWTAHYASSSARLELILDPKGVRWDLFVEPDLKLAVNSPLRKFFAEPVGRLVLGVAPTSLLDGEWEVHIPLTAQTVTLELENVREMVPSWRQKLGLTGFAEEKRGSVIKITTPEVAATFLDRSIDGLYTLEEDCGTASNALHRRTSPVEPTPMYLFLDPTRAGAPVDDVFIFAAECDRLDYGNGRPIVASLASKWRPNDKTGVQKIEVKMSAKWISRPRSKLYLADVENTTSSSSSTFSTPLVNIELGAKEGDCSSAEAVLSAKININVGKYKWAAEEWTEVDLQKSGVEVFGNLAWMLARSPPLEILTHWQSVRSEGLHEGCTNCCPPPPAIQWMQKASTKAIYAFENGHDAAKYEHDLKARPSPILVHTRQVGQEFHLRIGLNIASLSHKALDSLPSGSYRSFPQSAPSVEWRLNSSDGIDIGFAQLRPRPVFTLPDNRSNEPSPQPPHFKKYQLRPEQLRSLTWMIEQENNILPWIEEEVSEAVLPQLGWHVEAKATRSVTVRGGVLADAVGYGKTAITIGLITSQLSSINLPEGTNRVPVKATLIVLPPALTSQWPLEIKKFASGKLKVLVIKDMADFKKISIAEIRAADVVIISVAVFKSPLYWPAFGDFCGGARAIKTDEKAGRYFTECVDEALQALPSQLDRLQNAEEGPKSVLKVINAARKKRAETAQFVQEPSRRLKGEAYKNEQLRQDALKKSGKKIAEPKAGRKPAAAKIEVKVEADPWKLGEKATQNDWQQTRCPPLSMFSFERIVIDEFTYLEPVHLAAVRAIEARSRWILSGTPPMKGFSDIKTIANLLHIHLGIDDQAELTRERASEKTAAERFHSYRDVHTAGWHYRRDEVAQLFLNQYARQNWAEIDEIKFVEEIIRVDLPAAEMAIYRELEHFLLTLDTNLTKLARVSKDKKGDRDVRLSLALGESKSPEEALLKRCSHFSLDMDEDAAALEDAPHVCDQILEKRADQLQDCSRQLFDYIRVACYMHRILVKGTNDEKDARPLLAWLDEIEELGDSEAEVRLRDLSTAAGCTDKVVGKAPSGTDVQLLKDPKLLAELKEFNAKKDSGTSEEEYKKVRIWALRSKVHELRSLQKELLARFRSKRYFEAVRDIQQLRIQSDDLAVLSCCGHTGSIADVSMAASTFKCVDTTCRAGVRPMNVVLAPTLGVESKSGTFGVKLQTLVDLIDTVPKDEKILVFVQFDDLFNKTREALESYGITVSMLTGATKAASSMLSNFQDPESDSRVLLLKVTDSTSAGANLTVANWAFLVSPLLTEGVEDYRSFETQAIGRLRRFGQQKPVTLFRLITADTIDVKIYEDRSGKNVADVLATQTIRKILPTTQEMDRQPARGGGKSAAIKGKGRAKKSAVDSDEESDAASSEDEGKRAKAKPKAKPKSKVNEVPASKKVVKKAKIVASEEDVGAEESVKPLKKKKKAAPIVLSSDDGSEEAVASLLVQKTKPKVLPAATQSSTTSKVPSTSTPAASTAPKRPAPTAFFSIFGNKKSAAITPVASTSKLPPASTSKETLPKASPTKKRSLSQTGIAPAQRPSTPKRSAASFAVVIPPRSHSKEYLLERKRMEKARDEGSSTTSGGEGGSLLDENMETAATSVVDDEGEGAKET